MLEPLDIFATYFLWYSIRCGLTNDRGNRNLFTGVQEVLGWEYCSSLGFQE